jgi:E3 ubiquitin-protein ligase RNF1/2
VKKRSAAKAIDSASAIKTRGYMRSRRRGRTSSPDIAPTDFDDEDREENGNDGSKESSSVDDHHSPDVRQKRARRWPVPRHSPVKTTTSIENSTEDNDNSGGVRDILATSPLRGEMLAWGKNGTRSQTRHGNAGGSSGRTVKTGRVARLVDQLHTSDEFDTKVKRKCTRCSGI